MKFTSSEQEYRVDYSFNENTISIGGQKRGASQTYRYGNKSFIIRGNIIQLIHNDNGAISYTITLDEGVEVARLDIGGKSVLMYPNRIEAARAPSPTPAPAPTVAPAPKLVAPTTPDPAPINPEIIGVQEYRREPQVAR